jgi:hypothetical protein
MSERKTFSDISPEDNAKCAKMANEIYASLSKHFSEDDINGLDNIMNSLCGCLVIMLRRNVARDNHKPMLQVIHRILTRNLHD